MTSIDLRNIRIQTGEQLQETYELELDPFELGGQQYVLEPEQAEASLTTTRTTSGFVFELAFDVRVAGPCFRCLAETGIDLSLKGREYHATGEEEPDEDLRTPYVEETRLDLSTWARDAIALALPEKILCRPDCAGLCATCGRDLNLEPHTHEETEPDPRWAALAELRDKL
jgi:uncharacterized protein